MFPPQVHMKPLTVDEGGECWVGPDHLLLTDHDSTEESLRVELKREPQHGAVQLDGVPMKPSQNFTVRDLKSLKVRSDMIDDTSLLHPNTLQCSCEVWTCWLRSNGHTIHRLERIPNRRLDSKHDASMNFGTEQAIYIQHGHKLIR